MEKTSLQKKCPIIKELLEKENILWFNNKKSKSFQPLFTLTDVEEAEQRLSRFAPFLAEVFPELEKSKGLIESPILPAGRMKSWLEAASDQKIRGSLWIKADHLLPVAGSVKARGGIYEVLVYAEQLAVKKGFITKESDYRLLAGQTCKQLFANHKIIVGSTGNLGVSIGIMGAAMGFQVTVHMSADAKQWKKDLLRQKGAEVIEHGADYEQAVAEGRKEAGKNRNAYFVDDENSHTLFLGYAVAALRLKQQLEAKKIQVNEKHPLYVYLPCGIGGAPGGIAFGLWHVFGQHVRCFFAEPSESPAMLLGLATGLHDQISVYDIGLSNQTAADGLAVGRPSGFAGKAVEPFLEGCFTISDRQMHGMLAALSQIEQMNLEPSALAGMIGPILIQEHLQTDEPVHLVWSTGGSLVPEQIMDNYIAKGKKIISENQHFLKKSKKEK